MDTLKVGDKVAVIDEGLAAVRKFAPKNSRPNNHGTVAEIWDDGMTILVSFPIGKLKDNHNQIAPYPAEMVYKR